MNDSSKNQETSGTQFTHPHTHTPTATPHPTPNCATHTRHTPHRPIHTPTLTQKRGIARPSHFSDLAFPLPPSLPPSHLFTNFHRRRGKAKRTRQDREDQRRAVRPPRSPSPAGRGAPVNLPRCGLLGWDGMGELLRICLLGASLVIVRTNTPPSLTYLPTNQPTYLPDHSGAKERRSEGAPARHSSGLLGKSYCTAR